MRMRGITWGKPADPTATEVVQELWVDTVEVKGEMVNFMAFTQDMMCMIMQLVQHQRPPPPNQQPAVPSARLVQPWVQPACSANRAPLCSQMFTDYILTVTAYMTTEKL